jgi:dipeptidyl aminopeptidase/acylaminoacyl peptidase/peroxiredoxin
MAIQLPGLRSAFLLLALAASLAAQARRPLTHDDYDQWQSLRGQTWTHDGAWVAYQLEPQQGDGVLVVREVASAREYRHDFGSSPRFTADGRYVVFTLGTSKVAERQKKIDELRQKAKAATTKGGSGGEEGGAKPEAEAAAAPRPTGVGPRGGRRGAGGPGGPGGPGGGGEGEGGGAAARERGELVLLELATGTATKLGKVKGSTVSDDVPFLLFLKEKPEAKPAGKASAGEPSPAAPAAPAAPEAAAEPKPPTAGETVAGGEGTAPAAKPASEPAGAAGPGASGLGSAGPGAAAGAAGGEGAVVATAAGQTEAGEAAPPAARRGGRRGEGGSETKADPLEQKRPEGTELVVRDLATGSERSIADVVAYGLSRQGTWLWYHTSAKQPKPDGRYGLFVQRLAGGDPIELLGGIAHVGNVTFDRQEQQLAFTSDLADFAADKPSSDLYLWNGADGPARRLAWAGAPGMPAGKRIAGGVAFSRDGSALTFDVHDAPAPEPLPILPEDKVTLDLWNWRDGMLQTQQQKRGGGERNPSWTAVWQRERDRFVVLGDDGLRALRLLGPSGARLLGTDGRAYDKETTWDGRYQDVWLVDGATGARTRILERLRGNASTSPGGRYVLWFSADYHWWSLDVASGERRDLTGALGVPFHRHDDDHPEPDSAYGLAGWTENDGAVLVYDEFDVWKIAPATGAAICLTDGHGRQQRLRLRVQQLPRADDREWVDDELLLTATQVDTMAEGFFADSVLRTQPPQRLLLADAKFGSVSRPRQGGRLFFTRSTFAEFPDLWTSRPDLRDAVRLSDANPQQQQYRWGKAELVRWVDGDGKDRQGVLVKPDDFDPTKRYPMMVHFYERMTQGLHSYVAPAAGTSPNASYYVSNGYLWFMPDVVYEIGYPGNSCVKCVVSGVQHLIAQGFVDSKAIAASGHSWGGYQTAFLVTRTHIFAAVESGAPVSNMLSAYGGIRYESGMSRQFQYEMTQSRIGGTPWEYPLRYQENSPIWFADKVQTPVLILHNDQDGAVPWTQGIEYFTALRRLGKECYLFNYNGEGHGLGQRANKQDWTRRMQEYFDHHCKGAPAPKWMTDGVPFHERETEKLPFAKSYVEAHLTPAAEPKPAAAEAVPAAATSEAAAAAPAPASAAAAPSGTSPDATAPAAGETRRGRRRGAAAGGAAPASRTEPPPSKLNRGDAAPDFTVADQSGVVHRLGDHAGRKLLLWFYPKANTPGCTAQGCSLRDEFAALQAQQIDILGVSFDTAADNLAFQQQQRLPFPLLCDSDRRLGLAYGACDAAEAKFARRIAVLVDGDGRVLHSWNRIEPATFAKAVLEALPL